MLHSCSENHRLDLLRNDEKVSPFEGNLSVYSMVWQGIVLNAEPDQPAGKTMCCYLGNAAADQLTVLWQGVCFDCSPAVMEQAGSRPFNNPPL